MTKYHAVCINDSAVLETLAAADNFDLLLRNMPTTVYLKCDDIGGLDYLGIARLRRFVSENWDDVVLLDRKICALKSALPPAAQGWEIEFPGLRMAYGDQPSDFYGIEDIQVICSSLQGLRPESTVFFEWSVDLDQSPAPPIVFITMDDYRQRLEQRGVLYGPSSQQIEAEADVEEESAPGPSNTESEDRCFGRMRLYLASELHDMVSKLSLQPTETRALLEKNLTSMRKLGPMRRYTAAPSKETLEELAARFPNFLEVINAIARAQALARLSPYSMARNSPILLLGAPGIGKTAFALALAKAFGTEFFEIRMNSATAGFSIGGSDLSWGNGRPGIIFNQLAIREIINPLGLLDEIDKVGGSSRYSPLGHLYTLLENDTAKRFQDEAIPIRIDTSHITWVATANDISEVEEPLLSRFTIFEVQAPTQEQTRAIAQNIYQALLSEEPWGYSFVPVMTDEVLEALGECAPREVRKLLLDALGNAAYEGREVLKRSDFGLKSTKASRTKAGFY